MPAYIDSSGTISIGDDRGEYVYKAGKYYKWQSTLQMYHEMDSADVSELNPNLFASYDPSADPEETEYGAPNITRESFFEADGTRKHIGTVMQLIKDTFPDRPVGKTDADLESIIEDQIPALDELDKTEAGFLSEQYGGIYQEARHDPLDVNKDGELNVSDILASGGGEFGQEVASAVGERREAGEAMGASFADSLAGQKAGQALSGTLGDVQQAAGKFGAQARQIYGGSGASMRGQIAGGKTIGREFEKGQDAYGLAKEEAGLKFREGMYGLEQDRFDETEFRDFLKQFATDG